MPDDGAAPSLDAAEAGAAAVFALTVFLAAAVFFFFTTLDFASASFFGAADVVPVLPVVCWAQGRTSDFPDFSALSAFFASLFKIAKERQRASVALLDASAGVPTTQMQALLAPQAFSSSPLQEAAAFLTLCFTALAPFGLAEVSALASAVFDEGAFAAAVLALTFL